jgi:hypothetical protein
MTTLTIPEYLEDERRNIEDTKLRTEDDAALIQSLHPGHHRTRKSPEVEAPAPVQVAVKAKKPAVKKAKKPAVAKVKKPAASKSKKTVASKTRKPAKATRKKPPVAKAKKKSRSARSR